MLVSYSQKSRTQMIFAKIIALPTPQGHNNRKIDFASKMIGENGKETENILNQISKHKKSSITKYFQTQT